MAQAPEVVRAQTVHGDQQDAVADVAVAVALHLATAPEQADAQQREDTGEGA
ncbi:hypothetical protein [Rohdeia mirabilis]|uniref:hypothetical protein n=1 Tax=Rohdeia mirabilis TaxID=2528008 RepID=UPI003AF3BEE1